ncbi:hypothetical protein RRG08_052098 [Elysia crispata]|uniref:Uncharacterized protein n=1 Tax=Elysia crispata TaxID=231223 RepID=A0AAE1DSB9_9GAST|nr:hypothetical protein RRG08_052098 [Elysia crispata]
MAKKITPLKNSQAQEQTLGITHQHTSRRITHQHTSRRITHQHTSRRITHQHTSRRITHQHTSRRITHQHTSTAAATGRLKQIKILFPTNLATDLEWRHMTGKAEMFSHTQGIIRKQDSKMLILSVSHIT